MEALWWTSVEYCWTSHSSQRGVWFVHVSASVPTAVHTDIHIPSLAKMKLNQLETIGSISLDLIFSLCVSQVTCWASLWPINTSSCSARGSYLGSTEAVFLNHMVRLDCKKMALIESCFKCHFKTLNSLVGCILIMSLDF